MEGNIVSSCSAHPRFRGAISSFVAKPENLFIAFWLVIGLCASVFARPWTGLDEGMHIARAEQIAEGVFLPEEVSIEECDVSLVNITDTYKSHKFYGGKTDSAIFELLQICMDCNRAITSGGSSFGEGISFPAWTDSSFAVTQKVGDAKVTWPFPNASLNSPLSYLPYALGFFFARLVTSSPWGTIAIMRIFGTVIFGAVVYFSIKKCPFGKWLMVAAALSPNSISVNSMVSADVLTNAFVYLYFAYILRFLVNKSFSIADWAALASSLCGMALLKMPYICFGLLLFVVVGVNPSLRSRRALLYFAIIGFGALALFLAWSLLSHGIESYVIWGKEGIDQELQKLYVLSHPLAALAAIVRPLLTMDCGLFGISGYELGSVPVWATSALYLFAFLAESMNPVRMARPRILAYCLFAIVLFAVLVIGLALYLTFTAVGAQIADGIQPRYFLPLLFPVMLTFYLLFICRDSEESAVAAMPVAGSEEGCLLHRYGRVCVPVLMVLILMLYLYFRVYAAWLPF